ncbi:MAG: SDR family NAD(P)-dependent oxidoreductase [Lachnospiraceae bacterium]|nr:SDR family NAD(P)-dependent oxidoreductase [Lachnospiraceae bacterium]
MNAYIVTGASGDIGGAIARRLAADSCGLLLCANKNAGALEALTAECEALGSRCERFCGDLSAAAQAEAMAALALSRFGKIDGLINTAGTASLGLLTDLSESGWNEVLASNLTTVYQTCRAVVPAMVSRKKGVILNISSVWGVRGASCEAAYSAAKGGVNLLTKALAKELAPSGISVNALALGMVDTKMNAMLSQEELDAIAEEIPAGRSTTPAETAQMVRLLLTAPAYLTGQVIGFDGGWF